MRISCNLVKFMFFSKSIFAGDDEREETKDDGDVDEDESKKSEEPGEAEEEDEEQGQVEDDADVCDGDEDADDCEGAEEDDAEGEITDDVNTTGKKPESNDDQNENGGVDFDEEKEEEDNKRGKVCLTSSRSSTCFSSINFFFASESHVSHSNPMRFQPQVTFIYTMIALRKSLKVKAKKKSVVLLCPRKSSGPKVVKDGSMTNSRNLKR